MNGKHWFDERFLVNYLERRPSMNSYDYQLDRVVNI